MLLQDLDIHAGALAASRPEACGHTVLPLRFGGIIEGFSMCSSSRTTRLSSATKVPPVSAPGRGRAIAGILLNLE